MSTCEDSISNHPVQFTSRIIPVKRAGETYGLPSAINVGTRSQLSLRSTGKRFSPQRVNN